MLVLLVSVYEVNALRILTQQMAVHYDSDWIDSSRGMRANKADSIVSVAFHQRIGVLYYRAFFVSIVCMPLP
jgi:hypothetical protein